MSRDDIQKLLGGYATCTLTPEEQRVLFEAALEDQELFETLAREDALREVLSEPAARAQLLAAVDDRPAPWYRNWWRPVVVMASALVVVAGIALWQNGTAPPEEPRRVAKAFVPPAAKPAETQNAPVLPPPPEVRRSASAALPPVRLPIPMPAAAPPPPPPPPQSAAATPRPAAPPPSVRQDSQATVSAGASALDRASQTKAQPQAQSSQSQMNQVPAVAPQMPVPPQIPAGFAAGNALLSREVPLRGVVTDATGAAIASATVTIRSVATGDLFTTKTDEHGAFSAAEVPGSAYQISATAAGFRVKTMNTVAPSFGNPEVVNLKLDVGAVAETVEVTAANDAVRPRAGLAGAIGGGGGGSATAGGRGGRGGGPGGASPTMAKKAASAPAPVQPYRIFRRVPGGDPVEVPASGSVSAGATLFVRVTPASNGYLRIVKSGGSTIADRQLRRGQTTEIPLPPFDEQGRAELQLFFSTQRSELKDQAPTVTLVLNIE